MAGRVIRGDLKKFHLLNINGDVIGSIEVLEEVVDTIEEVEPDIGLGYSLVLKPDKKILQSFSLLWMPVEERRNGEEAADSSVSSPEPDCV